MRYFRAFYRQLIQSVKQYHRQAHGLVFLIANTDDEFREAGKLVATESLDSIVPVRLGRGDLNEKQLRVAFSCARWSALAMLISHLRNSQRVIVLDVDMEQVKGMDDLLADVNADVQLLVYPSEFMNLVAFVSGSLVSLKVNAAGSAFLRSVAAAVDQCFSQDLVDWHLDQFALLVAYLTCQGISYKVLSQDVVLSKPFESKLNDIQRSNALFVSTTASISGVK